MTANIESLLTGVLATLQKVAELQDEQLRVLRNIEKTTLGRTPQSHNDRQMTAILLIPETNGNVSEIAKIIGADRGNMMESSKWLKFRKHLRIFKERN